MTAPLLEVRDLRVVADTRAGEVIPLEGFDLRLDAGEVVGIVGESGSGKTTAMRALLDLLASNARVTEGEISFRGERILGGGLDRRLSLRGTHAGMIFQSATQALDPVFKIGSQLREVLRVHTPGTREEHRARMVGLLRNLDFADPERVLGAFPHELSGGMRQRAGIAMAVITEPEVVIADECTSALDVTTQAEVVAMLRRLVDERGCGMLFVTHDLALASKLCTRLVVMYGGQVVEAGPVDDVLHRPRMPYTAALLKAVPHEGQTQLVGIPGLPPTVSADFSACRFAVRCSRAGADCLAGPIAWSSSGPEAGVRCVRPLDHDVRIEEASAHAQDE